MLYTIPKESGAALLGTRITEFSSTGREGSARKRVGTVLSLKAIFQIRNRRSAAFVLDQLLGP